MCGTDSRRRDGVDDTTLMLLLLLCCYWPFILLYCAIPHLLFLPHPYYCYCWVVTSVLLFIVVFVVGIPYIVCCVYCYC